MKFRILFLFLFLFFVCLINLSHIIANEAGPDDSDNIYVKPTGINWKLFEYVKAKKTIIENDTPSGVIIPNAVNGDYMKMTFYKHGLSHPMGTKILKSEDGSFRIICSCFKKIGWNDNVGDVYEESITEVKINLWGNIKCFCNEVISPIYNFKNLGPIKEECYGFSKSSIRVPMNTPRNSPKWNELCKFAPGIFLEENINDPEQHGSESTTPAYRTTCRYVDVHKRCLTGSLSGDYVRMANCGVRQGFWWEGYMHSRCFN